jgi:glycosyltransferase involved in cell wall biosynthesis
MSVFAVDPRRIGGVEMFARELSMQLHRLGWESVLCFEAEPPGDVRRFMEQPGVSIEIVPHTGSWRYDPSVIGPIARLLGKHRPEILHMHFTDAVGPLPWLARLYSVRRNYFTDHNSRPEGFIAGLLPLWKRAVAQFLNWPLTGAVAVSDYNATACIASGLFGPGRVTRIYNGVDLTRQPGDPTAFRQKYGIPEGKAIVLQVSWMIHEKGIPDLIDAAALVLAANRNVHFVLVGDGACMEEYRARVEQAGIGHHFTWTGVLDDPLGNGVYSAADIVCQVSRWQEAFGWVNAEAMTCRKPLVATRVGGIPEIVQDGVTGYLVAPRRPDDAAARIIHLLDNPALARQMGAAGRQVVEERFNLRTNVLELLKLYGV